jgi:hypothetical protein
MTGEEKKQVLVQKYGEDRYNEMAAKLWLLLGALNTSLYASAQLEPKRMKFAMKQRFNNLTVAINGFLNNFEKSATQEERDFLQSSSFENVAALAELIAMVIQVPASELDWYLDECKKNTFVAFNRSQGI